MNLRSTHHRILPRRAFLRGTLLAAGGLLGACQPASTPPAPVATATVTAAPKQEGQVLATGLDFPEGPAFDPQGNLWCTEMNQGNLIRLVDGKVERIPTRGRPNSLAFDASGLAWVPDSQQNKIRRYDPSTDVWEDVLAEIDGKPLMTPNDLTFDALGNLIFTCPNFASQDPTGYAVCLKPDGTAVKIVEGFYRPNGLDIVDGGKSLVIADTLRKQLFKGTWDAASAAWQDPQLWARVGGSEGPDGMVPGADGLLYCAIYGDGVIRVVDGAGKIVDELRLPGSSPTNAAIDPSGRLGLVVTETEKGQLLSLPWVQPGVQKLAG